MTGTTPDDDDPARELRRVVGRLGVMGPDRATRPGADGVVPADLVTAELVALAAEAAALRGDDHRHPPSLRPHAFGDQLVVLVHEVLDAGSDPQALAARLARLRRSL